MSSLTSGDDQQEPAPELEPGRDQRQDKAQHALQPPTQELRSQLDSFLETWNAEVHGRAGSSGQEPSASTPNSEPAAMQLYGLAVAMEASGRPDDGCNLRSRAFGLQPDIEKQWRQLHTPPAEASPPVPSKGERRSSSGPAPAGSGAAVASAAPTASAVPAAAALPAQPFPELIAGFSRMAIEPAPPAVEGEQAPPCPIARVPNEILIQILHHVAVADVGDFVRLSTVCRKMALIVATEQAIWRGVCERPEFGFAGMHFSWQCEIKWPWSPFVAGNAAGPGEGNGNIQRRHDDPGPTHPAFSTPFLVAEAEHRRKLLETRALVSSPAYSGSWKEMFRLRHRVRFNGCYITKVNYRRMGIPLSEGRPMLGPPVFVVTYYRYLRFFRDGTAVTLLTTTEPAAVVPQLTRRALAAQAIEGGPGTSGLPLSAAAAAVAGALRGRWCLGGLEADHPVGVEDVNREWIGPCPKTEADIIVETEGVNSKYVYRMDLHMQPARRSRGAGNRKLVWKGFCSYNRLTDSWARLGLGRDQAAWYFSRVKSYGMGE